MRKLFFFFVILTAAPLPSQVMRGVSKGSVVGPAYPALPFTQVGSDAVLKKGATYLGLQADAFATPRACWDGTQWVGSFSVWNTANAQWSTLFSTSPDLVTWTAVGLRNPTGGNYLLGNGGIGCPTGLTYKYYFAYETYASGATNVGIVVDGSNNLTSWVNTTAALPTTFTYMSSAKIVINPNTTKMEVWYENYAQTGGTNSTVEYQDSSDGAAWTPRGNQYTIPACSGQIPGEPAIAYSPIGGPNILVTDMVSLSPCLPARHVQLLSSGTAAANTWAILGSGFAAANATIPGLSVDQCFDPFIVWGNSTHTGPGAIAYLLTACGGNDSGGDNTDSDIVLARWQ